MQLLFARAWGFRLEDIEAEVWLWYGEADALIPVHTGRYLAEAIPNSQLTVYPGEGHMLLVTCWEEILIALAARE
jgi:pimeloyl-ACP methyl ester carboxylesterase